MGRNRLGRGCILAVALCAIAAAPPERPSRQGEPASPESALPKASRGVLPPGAADQVLTAGGKSLVTLIEPGAEPRAELRYTLVRGTKTKSVMAMDMSVAVQSKGQTAPSTPMPRMSLGFTVTVADQDNAGEFKIDSVLTTTSVDPTGAQQEPLANSLRPQLEAMKGISMAYWMNAKGTVHDYKLEIPPGVPPAAQQTMKGMSQSIQSMVICLPAEPVGLGGKWRVVSRIASAGVDLLQSAVYTLKAREGNLATLEVKLVQLAAKDTIHNDQMPAGMSAKLNSLQSSASGTTRVDLRAPAPESGTMTLKTAMDIAIQGAGADSESSVETTTTVQTSRP